MSHAVAQGYLGVWSAFLRLYPKSGDAPSRIVQTPSVFTKGL